MKNLLVPIIIIVEIMSSGVQVLDTFQDFCSNLTTDQICFKSSDFDANNVSYNGQTNIYLDDSSIYNMSNFTFLLGSNLTLQSYNENISSITFSQKFCFLFNVNEPNVYFTLKNILFQ